MVDLIESDQCLVGARMSPDSSELRDQSPVSECGYARPGADAREAGDVEEPASGPIGVGRKQVRQPGDQNVVRREPIMDHRRYVLKPLLPNIEEASQGSMHLFAADIPACVLFSSPEHPMKVDRQAASVSHIRTGGGRVPTVGVTAGRP